MTDIATIARAFTEAWSGNDLDTAAGYLADDVSFQGPMSSAEGKQEFLQGLGGFAPMVASIEDLVVLADDQQALLMYDIAMAPGGSLRAAERMVVRDGKIVSDTLVFDTAAMGGGSGG